MTTIDELIRRGDHAYTVHDYFTCTKEEWQTLKAAVLTQQPNNSAIVAITAAMYEHLKLSQGTKIPNAVYVALESVLQQQHQ
jgi:hypothetical protein